MAIQFEISLESESKYVPGSNAFDPKQRFEGKISKRLSYFLGRSKKLTRKSHILAFYKVSHSEDPGILDLAVNLYRLSCSKLVQFLEKLFGASEEVRESF